MTMRLSAALLATTLLPFYILPASAQQAAQLRPSGYTNVLFVTSEGEFTVRLDGRRAPLTVRNFLEYVDKGHYDGTIFHRVIPNFMAQGGGFDADLAQKPTSDGVPNEAGNGLTNRRGTIAMARTGDPHSGTAQFFINLVDNPNLDPNPRRWGYAVFGQVTSGMEVLDKIAAIETGAKGRFRSDVPKTTVLIESVARADAPKAPVRKPGGS